MAAFDPTDAFNGDRAFRLVSNTFVTMHWNNTLLLETLDWLEQRGYKIVELDTGNFSDTAALLDGLANAPDFPNYFGRNLDAFNDCMRDVADGHYGSNLDATGFVLILTTFDALSDVIQLPHMQF